ncbi:hypothetical protein V8F06_007919 [Rhypophila decipiens]
MGSNNATGEKEKLPIPPDINQISNRISLGISHHNLLSSTLKKKPTTSTTRAPDSTSSNTKKGFSSLATNANNSAAMSKTVDDNTTQGTKQRSITRLADLDAEFEIHGGPPNAGVGYQPEKTSLQGSLTGNDRKLGAQMLGRKRGREDSTFGKKNRNGVNESESEDDVGRSALGRVKKLKAATTVALPKEEDAVQDVIMEDVDGEAAQQQAKTQGAEGPDEESATEKEPAVPDLPAAVEPTSELDEERLQGGVDEQLKKKQELPESLRERKRLCGSQKRKLRNMRRM